MVKIIFYCYDVGGLFTYLLVVFLCFHTCVIRVVQFLISHQTCVIITASTCYLTNDFGSNTY